MSDLRELFDVAEDGQLSLAVTGEQMPLDDLARPPAPREPAETIDGHAHGARLEVAGMTFEVWAPPAARGTSKRGPDGA